MITKKRIVRDVIYNKYYDGIRAGIRISEIPPDLLPTDILEIQQVEGFYSENESWDDHTTVKVYREREETDEEFEKRKKHVTEKIEEMKKSRYEHYLKLKKEFEGNVVDEEFEKSKENVIKNSQNEMDEWT